MKFTAERESLLGCINMVIRATTTRSTMPILECFLIRTEDDGLTLTGNDTEMGIESFVTAMVQEGGPIAIDAKMFAEIVRKMPGNDVQFSSDEKYTVTLKSGKSKFNIPGRSGDDFMALPSVKEEESFSMSQNVLKEMIQTTIFAADSSEKNKMMTGEHLEIKDGYLSLTALDGHRLALRRTKDFKGLDTASVIIPGKAFAEVGKMLSADDMQVTVGLATNYVQFDFWDTKVIIRLLDGAFYNLGNLMNRPIGTEVTVNRNDMIACTGRAGLFVREGDQKPIILDITDNEIQFSIRTPTGEMTESLDAEKTGEDLLIGFNPRFLMDVLKVIGDETVTLRMNGEKGRLLIADEDRTYQYVVLPVRLNG